ENAILTDPASVKITLAPQKIQAPQMVAMWHAKYGIVLTGQKVPMPSGDRVLQLWLIPKAPGSKPMPSMTLRPDSNGNFVILVSNPPETSGNTKALAITEEPAGGSAAPTTTPKWVGTISLFFWGDFFPKRRPKALFFCSAASRKRRFSSAVFNNSGRTVLG